MEHAKIAIIGHGSLNRLFTKELLEEIQRTETIELLEPLKEFNLEILSSGEYTEHLKPKTNYFEHKKKYRFLNKK